MISQKIFSLKKEFINGSNVPGIVASGNTYVYNFPEFAVNENLAEKKKEKPKKKKPKQLPEDNKVVPAGSGSGFFVSNEGHVITNHHVIDGCNTTKVSFKGNQVDAQILAVDKMNDIAILKTNIKQYIFMGVLRFYEQVSLGHYLHFQINLEWLFKMHLTRMARMTRMTI